MNIVDCFTYFNEKELLELRIKLLYDYVDKFIIVDADKTHKGEIKDFTCKNTLFELGIPTDKIQVIEIKLPSYDDVPNPWVRERMQRNIISEYITKDDICIISDCDEIINPKNIKYYTNIAIAHPNNILRIPMVFLMNRADLRVYDNENNPIAWPSPFICLKHHLYDYSISEIRESNALNSYNIKYTDKFIIKNGNIKEAGWHFSWMGDNDRLRTKIHSFLHWNEVNLIENFTPQENSTDCIGRTDHILKKYPINLLPDKIFELENIRNFLLPLQPNVINFI